MVRSGFFIVADDLTGAMDTGVQFACLGYPTTLRMGDPGSIAAERAGDRQVLAVTTDSRELPAGQAAALVSAVAGAGRGRRFYKKIDSTLRGNIGAELDALMSAAGVPRALLTPAYPDTGRVVRDGVLFVEGRPLLSGECARDPACPPTDHVPTLIECQSRRHVTHLPLAVVRCGPQAIVAACSSAPEGIVVCDAERAEDMLSLARAALRLGDSALASGSAGLAQALAHEARPAQARSQGGTRPGCRRVLVVAGSRRQVTIGQIGRAVSEGAVWPIPASLQRTSGDWAVEIDRAFALPSADGAALLSVSATPYLESCELEVARAVAACAAVVASRWQVSGLALVGGATARAVCAALGIRSLEIVEEILPGVALGQVDEGPSRGLWVATKAGGFGQTEALIRIVEHLMGAGDA